MLWGKFMSRKRAIVSALTVLLCSTALSLAPNAQEHQCPGGRTRIVGGEAALLANWPGQATLRVRSQTGDSVTYFCGGTAIADRWVLTAAHCLEPYLAKNASGRFDDKPKPHGLEVVLGSADLTKTAPENVFSIERIVMHERYRYLEATAGDDIALVRLARAWTGPTARLSLSSSSDPVTPPSMQVRVAGFGSTEPDFYKTQLKKFSRADRKGELQAGSAILLETAVETIATDQCQRIMRDQDPNSTIGAGQICAGLEQGDNDSCRGDSGGPLAVTDARGCPWQIGVVSWGSKTCAAQRTYGVYTRVSHYADWIQKHTGPLKGAAPLAVVTAGHALTAAQLNEGLRQLESLLGRARGRVSIGVRGGNRVKLGNKVVFEAASDLPGKLVILDINANREVLPLYPNKFVATAKAAGIGAGQRVTVPGPDYPGFTSFQAAEPIGKGRLLALVVPEDFDIDRFVAAATRVERGFQPVNDPPTYLMRMIRQIETALGSSTRGGGDDELKKWGYTMAEYEIVR